MSNEIVSIRRTEALDPVLTPGPARFVLADKKPEIHFSGHEEG
jgi:hypothetical protein